MAVRVLRLMEYIYPDDVTAYKDMSHWLIQGVRYYGPERMITSTVIMNPTQFEAVVVKEMDNGELAVIRPDVD